MLRRRCSSTQAREQKDGRHGRSGLIKTLIGGRGRHGRTLAGSAASKSLRAEGCARTRTEEAIA